MLPPDRAEKSREHDRIDHARLAYQGFPRACRKFHNVIGLSAIAQFVKNVSRAFPILKGYTLEEKSPLEPLHIPAVLPVEHIQYSLPLAEIAIAQIVQHLPVPHLLYQRKHNIAQPHNAVAE